MIKIFFYFLLSLTALWLLGLLWFIQQIPKKPSEDNRATDAIVVLTGGSLRLEHGLDLIHAGKAKKLFISGVGKGVRVRELLRKVSMDIPGSEDIIVLGYEASDTRGNAEETARWMRREKFSTLRLVTANYHIPRSLWEFQHAMPGILIISAPVFPENFKQRAWWRHRSTARLILLEYHKYLAIITHNLLQREQPPA